MLPHDMIIQFISLERHAADLRVTIVVWLQSCLALEDTISMCKQAALRDSAVNRRPH